MPLTTSDRFVCFGFEDDSPICHCTCLNKALDRKLMEYCKKYPKHFRMTSEQIFDDIVEGHEFEIAKHLISIRQPTQKKREMTEEQKKNATERLEKARKAKAKEKKEKVKDDKK